MSRSNGARVASAALSLCLGSGALAQVAVDGVMFIDRAATGEITLGNVRGSIGVIDFDGDGFMDLYIPNVAGQSNRLFRNVATAAAPGGRAFQDVTAGSGLDDAQGTARLPGGVAIVDFNNDGRPDIFAAGGASDQTAGLLYANNGNGTFTDVTIAAGARLTGVAPDSVSATDFDNDGDVDLFVAATLSPGRTLSLLVNNGNGTFTLRRDLTPTISHTGRIYAHVWNDFDGDGFVDCLVCLNAASPLALRNVPAPGGGRMLVDATTASGFTTIGPAPMGIAAGDMDNDGDLDLAITDASRGTYFENRAGVFVRVTPFQTFFGWGTTWLDADNDGRLDNYQAGSFGGAAIDHLRLNKGGGVWTDARAALNTPALASQYSARVDIDNDGRQDLITINPGAFISVYRNESATSNHWAGFALRGSGGVSRDAVGAVVRVTAGGVTQVREIAIGSSFTATEDQRAHFGLGASSTIDRIEVVWPRTGSLESRRQVFEGPIDADRYYALSPAGSCRGDSNGDGVVTFTDVTTILANFGDRSAGLGSGDANADGVVDFSDITEVLARLNQPCESPS